MKNLFLFNTYGLDIKEHRPFIIVSSVIGYIAVIALILYVARVLGLIPTIASIIAIGILKNIYDYSYLKKHNMQDRFLKNKVKLWIYGLIVIILITLAIFLRYR